MESRMMVLMKLFAGRHRHREQQSYGPRGGEKEGEGGTHGESNMETYITLCKVDSQWKFVV